MEVGDLFTVFMVMLNCPPRNTAPLNGPAAGKLELFMNEDSQHSVATPLCELDSGFFSIDVLVVFHSESKTSFSVVRLRRYCNDRYDREKARENTIRLNRGF